MTILLLIIAAVAKSVSDCARSGKISGAFWDENIAWKNKWKNGDPAQGERFFGSSTVFVAFTSGFHLMQLVYLNAFFAALVLYSKIVSPLADFFIFGVAFRLIFELSYRGIEKWTQKKA